MKIAVITFSDFNTNYGSVLQALSLRLYLESQGHTVEFIRYREFNSPPKLQGSVCRRMILRTKAVVVRAYYALKKKDAVKREANFRAFIDQHLPHTELYTSSKQMREKLQEYDAYICGSDQIWNADCLGGVRTPYFLDFAPENKIKIAYAASLGDYVIPQENEKVFADLLDGLDYISVREVKGKAQLSQLTDKSLHVTVDPVFLTDAQQWYGLLPASPIQGEYGVCYFVRRSKFGKRILKELKEHYKMPIYNLSDNMIYLPGTSAKYIAAGPLEFLSILKNASFAFGTSFHLAAFSVLFNKPMLIAGMASNRDRLATLLEFAGRSSAYVTPQDDLHSCIEALGIDRAVDDKLLKNFIAASKVFLDEALKEAENGR